MISLLASIVGLYGVRRSHQGGQIGLEAAIMEVLLWHYYGFKFLWLQVFIPLKISWLSFYGDISTPVLLYLGGWTSIYQLFGVLSGYQGFDSYPYGSKFLWHNQFFQFFAFLGISRGKMGTSPRWFVVWLALDCRGCLVMVPTRHLGLLGFNAANGSRSLSTSTDLGDVLESETIRWSQLVLMHLSFDPDVES